MALNLTKQDWLSCCGSSQFAKEMVKVGPFDNVAQAMVMSRDIWWNKVDIPGWLEAFAAHPKIGDVKAVARADSRWCESEQSVALTSASDHILQELAEWNRQYQAKFGFVFLVCATGKSSTEVLTILKERYSNRPIVELEVAAGEQQKITELRLAKFLFEGRPARHPGTFRTGDSTTDRRLNAIESHVTKSDETQHLAPASASAATSRRPQITSHVLDVSMGRAASGVEVILEKLDGDEWIRMGGCVTNDDGRAGALMKTSDRVEAGRYRLTFNSGKYFMSTRNKDSDDQSCFYPSISVVFQINPSQLSQHFHVPLLLSPFSFTTYRGT